MQMSQKTEEESAVLNCQPDTECLKIETTNAMRRPNSTFKTKAKRPNGRLGKRKSRKTVRIKSLDAIDFLHNETLLSTTSEGNGKKLPPPHGCVDYQFTALTALAADTVPIHSELPPATHDTPYGLQVLLDLYKEQFLFMIRNMKSEEFRKNVETQIIDEKARKQKLTAKLGQLEKQINLLIGDSLKLLRTRMAEIGISNGYSTKDLMVKAKEIMLRHHELQGEAVGLKHEIPDLEVKNVHMQNTMKENAVPANGDGIPTAKIDILNLQAKSAQFMKKNEEQLPVDVDDFPVSDFKIHLKAVNDLIQPTSVQPDNTALNITPCSIVLPRINENEFMDGAKLKLLTPAQKKSAFIESESVESVQDPANNVLCVNNENKPPSEKHENGRRHHHKSSKKSRKSKKKKHQDTSPNKLVQEHGHSEKYYDVLSFSDIPVDTSIKTEPYASSSYSSMAPNIFKDPLEDIITKTLNNNYDLPYFNCNSEPQMPSHTILQNVGYTDSGVTNGDKVDQSDYRRVPPMKIALKKFAQENRARQMTSANLIGTTVGDLVSSEIEKSLEISNRNTFGNQPSVPFDYSMHSRSTSTFDRREAQQRGSHEQLNPKSPFLTPTYVMPSPSYAPRYSPSNYATSTKVKEEPFEGLAASAFGAVNSCRSSEADSSRYSSPYYTPPMNLDYKMQEPNLFNDFIYSGSATRLPSEASSSADPNDANGNKWQEEVSLRFDRMFEFASNKIDSQEGFCIKSKDKSKLKNSNNVHSPTFNLNPPPLFRADSSFLDSPPMPDLPVSPASLEGPFSPVPSLSPPSLSSPSSSTPFVQNQEVKREHSNYNEKFHPKGKGWKWH